MDEKDAGFLTSVVYSPALERALALGYVRTRHASAGQEVCIRSGDELLRGVIVDLPVERA